jgi:transposase
MHSTTVAVDLAKNVFELAVADSEGKIGERLRLNRARFSSFFVHRAPCRVLMEACGSAHYWARRIGAHGSCCPRSTCASTSGATRLIAQTLQR